jgi:xanthine/uracil permease
MSYTDWLQKRWYIAIIIIGIAAALAQLFISRYSVTIGLLVGYAMSYVIYKYEYPEEGEKRP